MNSISAPNRIPLISLGIYTVNLGEVNNDEIANEIVKFNSDSSSQINNDPSLCATQPGERRFPTDSRPCSNLLDSICNAISNIASKKMIIESMWTSTLTRNEAVHFHSHKSNTHMFPMEYFSFAYYPRVPNGSADFVAVAPFCNILENMVTIKPENGMLIVFNSFVQHYTTRHNSDEPRIVVSGNCVPEKPNMTRIPDWSAYD